MSVNREPFYQSVMSLKDIVVYDHHLTDLEEARRQADAAVAGVLWFRFNGLQEIRTGRRGIDWKGGHYPHQEWRCQLRRFFQLQRLAWAYETTGDRIYAEAARDYIEDWMEQHPVQDGTWTPAPGDSMLDLSIRIGNTHFFGWLQTVEKLHSSDSFDSDFIQRIFESVHAQLCYLANHLTTLGNWRMCEADTLIYAALVWPESPSAQKWKEIGVEAINEGFLKQVLPDGAQYELTPGYHHWMTTLFHVYWQIGMRFPELGLRMDQEKLRGMFEYGFACYRPDGRFNAWNDSQSDHANNFLRWLRIWRQFAERAGISDDIPRKGFYPWARQAAFCESEGEEACYWTFEGAAGAGTHSHLGRNGFQLMEFGSPLLVDPGFLSYEASDPIMALGRSTRAHNTVSLNGWNQSLSPCTSFRHLHCADADLLFGQYEGGYWQGEFDWSFRKGIGQGIQALHHRIVFRMRNIGFLIVDQIMRYPAVLPEKEPPFYELNWQLNAEDFHFDRDARRLVTHRDEANVLMMFPLLDSLTEVRKFSGSKEPLRGWIANKKGLTPAAQVSLARPMPERYAELITVVVPFRGTEAPAVQCRAWRPDPNFVSQVVLDWSDGASDEITWTHRLIQPIGRCGHMNTDAPLIWLRRSASGLSRFVHFGKHLESERLDKDSEIQQTNFWELP